MLNNNKNKKKKEFNLLLEAIGKILREVKNSVEPMSPTEISWLERRCE